MEIWRSLNMINDLRCWGICSEWTRVGKSTPVETRDLITARHWPCKEVTPSEFLTISRYLSNTLSLPGRCEFWLGLFKHDLLCSEWQFILNPILYSCSASLYLDLLWKSLTSLLSRRSFASGVWPCLFTTFKLQPLLTRTIIASAFVMLHAMCRGVSWFTISGTSVSAPRCMRKASVWGDVDAARCTRCLPLEENALVCAPLLYRNSNTGNCVMQSEWLPYNQITNTNSFSNSNSWFSWWWVILIRLLIFIKRILISTNMCKTITRFEQIKK